MTSGTSQQDKETPRKSKPGLLDFLKTVPGILTAVATLITAIAGASFYGGTQLSSGAPQPTVTVTVTAPARTVTESAAATHQGFQGQTTPEGSDPSSAAGNIYLSSLTPLQDNEPGTVIKGPQQIGMTPYPDTVRLTCYAGIPSSVVYDVAGYKTLRATLGVPSDATNASGNSAAVQFLKDGTSTQLTSGITVALDQPQVITVPLKGASQLGISCSGSNGNIDIALANATLNP